MLSISTLAACIVVPTFFEVVYWWIRKKEEKGKNIQQAQEYLNKIKNLPNTLNKIFNHPFTDDDDILSTKQAVHSLENILINYFKVNYFQQTLSYFKNFLNDLTSIDKKIEYENDIWLIFSTIYTYLPQDIIENMKLKEGLSNIKEKLKKLDDLKKGLVYFPQNVHYIEIKKNIIKLVFINFLNVFEKNLNHLLKNLVKYIEAHKEKDKKSLREITIKEQNKILNSNYAESEYCLKARAAPI